MTYTEFSNGSVHDGRAIIGRVIKGRFFRLNQLAGNPAVSIVPKSGEKGVARRQGDPQSLADAIRDAFSEGDL